MKICRGSCYRRSWRDSYFVWLCGFYYEAVHVDLVVLMFSSVLFSTLIASSGEERAPVHLYVYFACVTFCPFLFLLLLGLAAEFYIDIHCEIKLLFRNLPHLFIL